MKKLALFDVTLREAPDVITVLRGMEEQIKIALSPPVKTFNISFDIFRLCPGHQLFTLAFLQSQLLDGGHVCCPLLFANVLLLQESGAKSQTFPFSFFNIEAGL
jgi:hypothetical protein